MFYSTSQNFIESSDAIKQELEIALKRNDLKKLKEILWQAKAPNITRVSFIPSKDFALEHGIFEVGKFSKLNFFEVPKSYPLVLSGFTLGRIKTYINTFDLIESSFWNNMDVLLFLSIFFLIIILFSNVKTSRALANIEKRMDFIREGDLGNLEKSLSEIPEKSWSAISGFKEFIYNHLKLSEEKVALDQELNEFEYRYKLAREVAHGIKSPVHTLNVLNKKLINKLEENEKKLFEMALGRINFHANELLVQAPKNQKISQINVNRAISKFISLKKNEFSKYKNIKITYHDEVKRSLSLPLQGIYEVLSNLINNAFDAIENESGEIKIVTKLEGDNLIVQCEDSGKGIPQAIIGKIWDEDFSHEKKHGTGIGLSVIKDLVEKKWYGSCAVDSAVGCGSRFKLEIPI